MIEGVNDEQSAIIHTALIEGRKIAAIKTYREATGNDLKTSKEAVEALVATDPQTYAKTAQGGAGCASLIVLGFGLTAALGTRALHPWA